MKHHCMRYSSRGDTIVEVLIAIAIISSVLAGAFTVTQKSALAVRDSQERSEMLQILQGQVESVRAIATKATSPTDDIFTAPAYFCIDSSNAIREFSSKTSVGDYPSECKDLGNGDLYRVAARYNSSTNVFTFYGDWDKIGGGNSSMQLSYRYLP